MKCLQDSSTGRAKWFENRHCGHRNSISSTSLTLWLQWQAEEKWALDQRQKKLPLLKMAITKTKRKRICGTLAQEPYHRLVEQDKQSCNKRDLQQQRPQTYLQYFLLLIKETLYTKASGLSQCTHRQRVFQDRCTVYHQMEGQPWKRSYRWVTRKQRY